MKDPNLRAQLLEALAEIRRQIVEFEALENERKEAEEALRESEEKYRLVVENANEAIVVAQDGMLKFFNPKAMEVTGYPFEELSEKPFVELIHPEDLEMIVQNHLNRLNGAKFVEIYPFRIVDKKGETKWVEINAVLISWKGRPATLNFLNDITERKKKESELWYLTTHDSLTGLYNRTFFEEEMARMEKSRQYPISVVMADVDDLKGVNDSQGHAAGDDLLHRAGRVLKDTFRAEDIIARIGGDELAVLLPGTDGKTVEESLNRVRDNLVTHNANHNGPPLSLSLGAATADRGEGLAEALKEADKYMYLEKQARSKSRTTPPLENRGHLENRGQSRNSGIF